MWFPRSYSGGQSQIGGLDEQRSRAFEPSCLPTHTSKQIALLVPLSEPRASKIVALPTPDPSNSRQHAVVLLLILAFNLDLDLVSARQFLCLTLEVL